jgi:hypothetical protein
MTYKPNEILDGMTREEALLCVFERRTADKDGFKSATFRANNNSQLKDDSYGCPGQMLLTEEDCGGPCAECWERHINAYYDAKEAASKPRWVEPSEQHVYLTGGYPDLHYSTNVRAEIARTNARRKIEAFIKANGGSGCDQLIHYGVNIGKSACSVYETSMNTLGTIYCATRELAEAVIEKYSDELRLLCNKEGGGE